MNEIPTQLKNTAFRFAKVGINSKRPLETKWTTKNSYQFFNSQIHDHLLLGGNIVFITGIDNIIVLDFDNKEFYEKIKEKNILPRTFAVTTATKRLPHLYYRLKGEMIKKIGVDIKGERVLDVQADKCGVICPPSKINRNYYDILDESPITEITQEELKKIVGENNFNRRRIEGETREFKPDLNAVKEAQELLLYYKIERTMQRNYACPMHKSENKSCLHLNDDGSLYCFHCLKRWKNVHMLIEELKC